MFSHQALRSSRRRFLQVGALGTFGLSLPQLLQTEAVAKASSGKAKSCIFLFLFGGPSHVDTWDMKPTAPAEIRGEFKAVDTTVPGIQICEHLPKMARLAQRYSIVRTLYHTKRNHNPAGGFMLTGVDPLSDNATQIAPKPDDPPGLGALASRLAPSDHGVLPYVMLPARLLDQGANLRGQAAGWMGSNYDPLLITQDPSLPGFRLDAFGQREGIPQERLVQRRDLLTALDPKPRDAALSVQSMEQFQRRALDLVISAKAQAAFDITHEPASVRDRYGRNMFGQGCLLARRLIEAGCRLVTVSDCTSGGSHMWDTHSSNFRMLKGTLLPRFDQAYSALLEDLIERGLLQDTVVYAGGEFGRSPKVGYSFGTGASTDGRDHYPCCFSGVLAGGRTRTGMVYGQSDSKAAYPNRNGVTPEDLTATLFAAMGLDPEATVYTREQRPMPVTHGKPIAELLS
jgi:hypothetical protein